MNDAASVAAVRRVLPAILPRLRRFARTLARNPHDADDLAQGTIERALRHAAQWRPPDDPSADQLETAVRCWMFGIMKNAWIDNRRAHSRERGLFAAAELPENIGDNASTVLQDRLSLESALEQLPDEQRLAVSLVLVEGLSYQEAADVLEVPIGTVTSRLARGRAQLARLLSATGESA
jgi:RNA polymerase sigma-70 factor (ECF subfamily)